MKLLLSFGRSFTDSDKVLFELAIEDDEHRSTFLMYSTAIDNASVNYHKAKARMNVQEFDTQEVED